eukprot:tig00020912_g15876.t1
MVAASASAPSRLPGGLEGDALVQGAAGVESGPTRLPRRRLRLLVCLAVLRATPWCRGRGRREWVRPGCRVGVCAFSSAWRS